MCLTWSLAVKSTWVQLGALGIGCRSCVLTFFHSNDAQKVMWSLLFYLQNENNLPWEYSWETTKHFSSWKQGLGKLNLDGKRGMRLERTFFPAFLG